MRDSSLTASRSLDQWSPDRTDLVIKLAVSVCRRSDTVESCDPAVRYRAIREAWEEAVGDRSGIATREQIKLRAAGATFARNNDYEIDRVVVGAFGTPIRQIEFRDVCSPAGTVVAVEVGGIIVVRDEPMRILAGAFASCALSSRLLRLERAMRSAWQAMTDQERAALSAAVDRPRTTAARVARASGMHWRQMVSCRSLMEEIVRDGRRVEAAGPPSLKKLRKRRLRELPRRKRIDDCDDDPDDDSPWPDAYRLEIEAERQADFEDRCALADNLSGVNANELD